MHIIIKGSDYLQNIPLSNSINYSNLSQLKKLYKMFYKYKIRAELGNYTALETCIDLERAFDNAMDPLQKKLVKAYLVDDLMPMYQLEEKLKLPRMKGVRELERALVRASAYLVTGKVISNREANRRIEHYASLKRKFTNI